MRSCLPGCLVFFLMLNVGGGTAVAAQQAGAPLSEREITYLLQKKVSSEALAEMVRSYGVAFRADERSLGRLRVAGASQVLLDAIRKQAKASEVEIEVVRPEPPRPEPEAVPAPAREHLQLGRQKLKNYDYEGALREFAEAEKIFPQWDQIFHQRGLVLAAMGRYSEAASEWKMYKSLASPNVDKAAIQQRITEWEGEANKVGRTRALLSRGDEQLHGGDMKGAVQSFREAAVLSNSIGAWLALANAQLQGGDFGGAADSARRAQAIDPRSGLAAKQLADAESRQAKPASPPLDQAAASNPGLVEARNRNDQKQVRSGQLDKTIAELHELIKLNPELASAHLKLANALTAKGDLDSAISSFREAIRLRPDSVQARNNLANALRSQGKATAAVEEYREAIKISQPEAYLQFNLANALADAGRFDEAIARYEVALKLDPNDPETHNNLAVAHAAAGNLVKAADEYHQAIRLRPDFARAHYNLGLLLERKGDRSAAISEFSEALRVQSDYSSAHFHLGMALEGTGKLQDALAHLRTSWELNPQNVNYLSEYERVLEAAKSPGVPANPVN